MAKLNFLRNLGFALGTTLALGACTGLSPYATMLGREIKALSTNDIEGLQAGRGMSLALAAELNGYPGPLHVLELADRIELSAEQRARTQALFEHMRRQAVAAGQALINEERQLDQLFASQTATPIGLHAALEKVAQAQARVREAHLQAHLEQVKILTPAQVLRYRELRGYAGRS